MKTTKISREKNNALISYLAFQVACNWEMSCRSSHVIKLRAIKQSDRSVWSHDHFLQVASNLKSTVHCYSLQFEHCVAIAYALLAIAYALLAIAYALLAIAYALLAIAYALLAF